MTQQFTGTKIGFFFYNWNQIQNKLCKQEPPIETITKKTHLEVTVWGQNTFSHSFKECFRKRYIKEVKQTNKNPQKDPKQKTPTQQTQKKTPQPSKKPQNQQKHNTQTSKCCF